MESARPLPPLGTRPEGRSGALPCPRSRPDAGRLTLERGGRYDHLHWQEKETRTALRRKDGTIWAWRNSRSDLNPHGHSVTSCVANLSRGAFPLLTQHDDAFPEPPVRNAPARLGASSTCGGTPRRWCPETCQSWPKCVSPGNTKTPPRGGIFVLNRPISQVLSLVLATA